MGPAALVIHLLGRVIVLRKEEQFVCYTRRVSAVEHGSYLLLPSFEADIELPFRSSSIPCYSFYVIHFMQSLHIPFSMPPIHSHKIPLQLPRANLFVPTRFKIEDARYADDKLAAWACIRLDRLQQGYRFIHLLDAKGAATPGLLLVKIEKKVRGWK